MKKIYIIRKVYFFTRNIDNTPPDLGDVIGVFDDYNQAYQSYLTCEKDKHQHSHLADFEIKKSKMEVLLKNVQQFFHKYFPQVSDFEDITEIPCLPMEATLEQTEEFIQISGAKYYHLSVHEEMPTYFRIKMADNFWGNEYNLPFTVPFFKTINLYFLHETEEEATNKALKVGYFYLWSDRKDKTNYDFMGLKGNLTDLSKTPDILETYLQNYENFLYDDEQQKIRLSPQSEESESVLKELQNLLSLLILKPFEIIQIDLESMKNKAVEIKKRFYYL